MKLNDRLQSNIRWICPMGRVLDISNFEISY